jgi:putative FmdB family regulatory protein
MPIYEYECGKCGKRFEYMQKMSEAPKKKCESCGGKLEKLISSSGFILKGGGWYKDLYSKKPGSGSGESKTETKSEAKTDTKSETKTDSKTEKKK